MFSACICVIILYTVRNLEYEYTENKKTLEDKFKDTIKKLIKWICKKFDLPSEDEMIRDFEKDTHTLLDAEKQISKEDREKELYIEI